LPNKGDNLSAFIYRIKNLSFSYQLGKEDVLVLKNLTLDIPAHQLVTISGPSGSGKSTLLNILGMIEPVQKGSVQLAGQDISTMEEEAKNEVRKFQIGFIFQQFHLIPVLSAEENVSYFLSQQNLPKEEIEKRTKESLQAVGLWPHRKKRPSEMSGGQKQRVAIARAIAKHPHVIIADEPTASLDRATGREIMEILMSLVKNKKTSIIISTHDPMVQSFATQNIHLLDGELSL
jgi:putative ABC transport system ATP-binding protein